MTKYRWKKRPYRHQIDGVKYLLKNGWGGALLMEPRTGKTKICVDYASIMHLKGEVGRVLIFAPVNALGVWKEQIHDNCPFPHDVTIWDKRARKKARTNGTQDLPKFGSRKLEFVIVNYDALSTPGKVVGRDEDGAVIRSRRRGGRYDNIKKLKLWQPDLVILDESHRIKSPSARKSYAAHAFHNIARYRVIATGTVVTKKKRIFDVYSQWKFLNQKRFWNDYDNKPMTFSDFKSEFAKFANVKISAERSYPKFIGNKNEDKLHELIHMDSFSKRRDECFDLPKRTTQEIYCDLEYEQSGRAYDEMVEDMIARIAQGEITEASIKLVQAVRLRQLTQGIAKTEPTKLHPEGRVVLIGNEKLRILKSRLEDLFEAEEKVIIGASFRPDVQRLQKLMKRMSIPAWTIQGGVKHYDRTRFVKEFNQHDGPAVFIGHPQAAGEAIDLRSAAIMIWYSLTPSWVQFQQFRDRNALSQGPTFEEVMIASPTDQMLWDTLQQDGDLGKMMITSPELLRRERNGS